MLVALGLQVAPHPSRTLARLVFCRAYRPTSVHRGHTHANEANDAGRELLVLQLPDPSSHRIELMPLLGQLDRHHKCLVTMARYMQLTCYVSPLSFYAAQCWPGLFHPLSPRPFERGPRPF